jgi:S-layer homology domain
LNQAQFRRFSGIIQALTEAQAARWAFGWPIDTTGGPHFSDVSPDNYAYGAVETAYNRGVVSGVGGGLFAPNASVTRAQIAKIVDLALTSP